jgi:hypothetical protein
MTNDPTERAALARAAARLSTASKARDVESPGVAQPTAAGSETDSSDGEREKEDTGREVDAQEKAHLGGGTAR